MQGTSDVDQVHLDNCKRRSPYECKDTDKKLFCQELRLRQKVREDQIKPYSISYEAQCEYALYCKGNQDKIKPKITKN